MPTPKRTPPSSTVKRTKKHGISFDTPSSWDLVGARRLQPKERAAMNKGVPETRTRGDGIGRRIEGYANEYLTKILVPNKRRNEIPKQVPALTKDELVSAIRKLPKPLAKEILEAFRRHIRKGIEWDRAFGGNIGEQ